MGDAGILSFVTHDFADLLFRCLELCLKKRLILEDSIPPRRFLLVVETASTVNIDDQIRSVGSLAPSAERLL